MTVIPPPTPNRNDIPSRTVTTPTAPASTAQWRRRRGAAGGSAQAHMARQEICAAENPRPWRPIRAPARHTTYYQRILPDTYLSLVWRRGSGRQMRQPPRVEADSMPTARASHARYSSRYTATCRILLLPCSSFCERHQSSTVAEERLQYARLFHASRRYRPPLFNQATFHFTIAATPASPPP